MFGIGGFELFIILVFGFLIFGPDKLPEIAKTVGKGIARFREAQQEMNDTLGGEKIFDPNNPDEPFKDPVEMLDKIAQKQDEKRAAKARGTAGAAKGSSGGKSTSTGAGGSAAAGAGGAVGASGGSASRQGEPRQESFTERKARYERERAARKAAEAEGADDGGVPLRHPERSAEGAEPTDLPRSSNGQDSSSSAQSDGTGQAHNAFAEGGDA